MRDKTKYIYMYVDKWCLRPKVCFRNATHIDWEIFVNCRYTYVCVEVCMWQPNIALATQADYSLKNEAKKGWVGV